MIKKKNPTKKVRFSLYLSLILNIIIGLAAAVGVYLLAIGASNYYINNHYLSPESQRQRREDYLEDLQSFVSGRKLTFEDTDRIQEWAREHKYVYLLVQKDDLLLYPSDIEEEKPDDKEEGEDGENTGEGENGETGGDGENNGENKEDNKEDNKDDPTDPFPGIPGGFTESRPSRDELIAAAQANGLHEIELVDGTLMVALTEFSQTLYLDISRLFSLIAAALVLAILLINYFRIIIKRINRLESDVNIVSHVDMNHEIVSRGYDEIATLSHNVEIMRNTMLENLKNEQEAREANTELITSISHDLRTPLTVLMGYVEMMKNHQDCDEEMYKYVCATESTAQRLKQLSDDMFRYSLAFGDAKKSITLEEYDAGTLLGQMISEHVLLMEEQGYVFKINAPSEPLPEGATVFTDAQNLMRIVDNAFSNLHKYADKSVPIELNTVIEGELVTIECKNKIRTDTETAESNGIGLKTCARLASLIAEKFEYENEGDIFSCRIVMRMNIPEAEKTRGASK